MCWLGIPWLRCRLLLRCVCGSDGGDLLSVGQQRCVWRLWGQTERRIVRNWEKARQQSRERLARLKRMHFDATVFQYRVPIDWNAYAQNAAYRLKLCSGAGLTQLRCTGKGWWGGNMGCWGVWWYHHIHHGAQTPSPQLLDFILHRRTLPEIKVRNRTVPRRCGGTIKGTADVILEHLENINLHWRYLFYALS